SGCGLILACGTGRIDTAFIHEEADKAVHRRIVRAADQGRYLPLLRYETCQDQPVEMMGKRRGRDPELLLNATDRQSAIARANQGAINLKPRRFAEGFELLCCLFDVHRNTLCPVCT